MNSPYNSSKMRIHSINLIRFFLVLSIFCFSSTTMLAQVDSRTEQSRGNSTSEENSGEVDLHHSGDEHHDELHEDEHHDDHDHHDLHGQIFDTYSGEPINAAIVLFFEENVLVKSTRTDVNGHFHIPAKVVTDNSIDAMEIQHISYPYLSDRFYPYLTPYTFEEYLHHISISNMGIHLGHHEFEHHDDHASGHGSTHHSGGHGTHGTWYNRLWNKITQRGSDHGDHGH